MSRTDARLEIGIALFLLGFYALLIYSCFSLNTSPFYFLDSILGTLLFETTAQQFDVAAGLLFLVTILLVWTLRRIRIK